MPATPLEHPEALRVDGRRLRTLSLAVMAASAGYLVCLLIGPAASVSGIFLHDWRYGAALLALIVGGTAGTLVVPGVRSVELGPQEVVVRSLVGSTRIPWGNLVRARADRALREIVLVHSVRDRRGRPRVRSVVVTEAQGRAILADPRAAWVPVEELFGIASTGR
jgi:hypothetical protein